ncbi:MAG: hypothetical protein LBN40_03425 [Oscillospiraceae bacterium]|jgi:WD40 repeat protein|nr:hypothetical protein [Oscillospiraceae bacterium]
MKKIIALITTLAALLSLGVLSVSAEEYPQNIAVDNTHSVVYTLHTDTGYGDNLWLTGGGLKIPLDGKIKKIAPVLYTDEITSEPVYSGYFFVQTADSKTKVYSSTTGKQVKSLSGDYVFYSGKSFGGNYIAANYSTKTLIIYNKSMTKLVAVLHNGEFSSAGQYLMAQKNGKTKVYDIKSGKLVNTLTGNYTFLTLFSNGKSLAYRTTYDEETGKQIQTFFTLNKELKIAESLGTEVY